MARFEVAVETDLAFSSGFELDRDPEDAVIAFEGLRFVWHANNEPDRDGEYSWPTVTVMAAEATYAVEMVATNRLLSALSHLYDRPIAVLTTAGAGFKGELDPPLLRQPPGPYARVIVRAPASVEVTADDRLRLILALTREARSARSQFYRYLAFYNALDAAFDGSASALGASANQHLPGPPPAGDPDWAFYLTKSLRHALAHTVRPAGRLVLDPDESEDQIRLAIATDKVVELLSRRLRERWPVTVTASHRTT